jgi:Holliday junction resolvase RusA-like endonuclease
MVRLTFPWSVLVPDNRRHGVIRNRIVLTQVYRDALDAVHWHAKKQHRGVRLTGPLVLDAVLFEPDRRRRDVSNYAKLLCDGMEGVIYEDDCQLVACTYRRGGLDPANPRAEVTVRVADEVAA